jgi:plastocyanin
MNRRALAFVFTLLGLVFALAACAGGGDDDGGAADGGNGGGTTLELAADPGGGFSFDKDTLEAPAGTVTIHLTNDAAIPHNVGIEGNGIDVISETVTGAETSVTAELEPGEYTFYCDVAGHREGGMEGTLTVS